MFSIDFPEIIIIFAVALVVLGPKKLPGAVAKIGRWVGRARSMARQFREQLEQEVAAVENAADIRKSIDPVSEPKREQPTTGNASTAEPGHTPTEAAPPEGVPQEAAADSPHQSAAEPTPYESSPYDTVQYGSMPPPEGYGPPPQQLSFDAQLHDTALPPDGVPSGRAESELSSEPADARDWMPETQTWMASAAWETDTRSSAEEAVPASQASAAPASRQSGAPRPTAHDAAPESAAKTPASHTETVEHDDR